MRFGNRLRADSISPRGGIFHRVRPLADQDDSQQTKGIYGGTIMKRSMQKDFAEQVRLNARELPMNSDFDRMTQMITGNWITQVVHAACTKCLLIMAFAQ